MAIKKKNAARERLGTEPKALGTEPGLSGLWKRLGTEPGGGTETGRDLGTETIKLATKPGAKGELKVGEERTMKVRLKKAKTGGKTVLRLELEG